jgi:hypothetical protein
MAVSRISIAAPIWSRVVVMSAGGAIGPGAAATSSSCIRAARTESRKFRARASSGPRRAVDCNPVRVSSSADTRSRVTCQAPAT